MSNNVLSPSPAPSTASPIGSGPETFGEAIPVALDTPPEPAKAIEDDTSPEATAELAVGGVDALCRWFGAPSAPPEATWELSERERDDLRRDLVAVLRKHDIADIPFAEEIQLGVTATAIAAPRIRRYREGKKNDRTVPGQEGRREDSGGAEASVSPSGGAPEVHGLLE